jgi:hypothetical protein
VSVVGVRFSANDERLTTNDHPSPGGVEEKQQPDIRMAHLTHSRDIHLSTMKALGQLDGKRLRKLAALAGILLLAAFAFVQIVHTHAGLAENTQCSICVVAHAPAAAVAPVVVPVLPFTHLRLILFESVLHNSDTLSLHFCRPPPPTA